MAHVPFAGEFRALTRSARFFEEVGPAENDGEVVIGAASVRAASAATGIPPRGSLGRGRAASR